MTDTSPTELIEGPSEMGTFDDEGNYTPREIVSDGYDDDALEAAYESTMVSVEDGQLVWVYAGTETRSRYLGPIDEVPQ